MDRHLRLPDPDPSHEHHFVLCVPFAFPHPHADRSCSGRSPESSHHGRHAASIHFSCWSAAQAVRETDGRRRESLRPGSALYSGNNHLRDLPLPLLRLPLLHDGSLRQSYWSHSLDGHIFELYLGRSRRASLASTVYRFASIRRIVPLDFFLNSGINFISIV